MINLNKIITIKALRVAGIYIPITLAAGIHMALVGPEIRHHRLEGEKCAHILAWCRENDIAQENELYIDFIAPALTNGFQEMIDLYLGKRIKIHNLLVLYSPPFLIYTDPNFEDLPLETQILKLKASSQTGDKSPDLPQYEKIAKKEFVKNYRTLPAFGFRYSFEVVKPEEVLERIDRGEVDLHHTVLLNRKPSFIPDASMSQEGRILSFQTVANRKILVHVLCPQPCLFLISIPVNLSARKNSVLVDDMPVSLLQANGPFYAIELLKGQHTVEVRLY
jgi:hypothetical protein